MIEDNDKNKNQPDWGLLDKYIFDYGWRLLCICLTIGLGFVSLLLFTGMAFSGSDKIWLIFSFLSVFIPMIISAINVFKPMKRKYLLLMILPIVPFSANYGIKKHDEAIDKENAKFCKNNPKHDFCKKLEK